MIQTPIDSIDYLLICGKNGIVQTTNKRGKTSTIPVDRFVLNQKKFDKFHRLIITLIAIDVIKILRTV